MMTIFVKQLVCLVFIIRPKPDLSRFVILLLDVKEGGVKEFPLPSVSSTLQGFIEGSTVGEFHTRLAMLLAFHCHVLLAPKQERHGTRLCSPSSTTVDNNFVINHVAQITCRNKIRP